MHTAFPSFSKELNKIMSFTQKREEIGQFAGEIKGMDRDNPKVVQEAYRFVKKMDKVLDIASRNKNADKYINRIAGRFTAKNMAALLKFGFAFITQFSHLLEKEPAKGMDFFDENFLILDPSAKDGKRYYQGRFLFRTDQPGDDMNVLLKFCPDPEKIFRNGKLDPLAVVSTEVLSETEADEIQYDINRVDVVIYLRDVRTMVGLIFQPALDLVGMLMNNMMHVKGNVGHIFKFGAIATNVLLLFKQN